MPRAAVFLPEAPRGERGLPRICITVALLTLVDYLFLFLYLALLVRVILSWVPGALGSGAALFICRITDPLLAPLRRLVPPVGGLDITPLIAFLVLGAAQRIVREILLSLMF